jgi:hypothetical protein
MALGGSGVIGLVSRGVSSRIFVRLGVYDNKKAGSDVELTLIQVEKASSSAALVHSDLVVRYRGWLNA